MIQTELLKLDPPYQIISARGYVGIQVGTLIVTREVDPAQNRLGRIANYIEFHSYPVVSYGLKQGLDEELKYNYNPLDDFAEFDIRRRMQPEGAVWSGVEVKDVRVLGLAGARNRPVGLYYFVCLIPTVQGYDPSLTVWDKESVSRIYELYNGLGDVGIKTSKLSMLSSEKSFPISLEIEPAPKSNTFFVRVLVKEAAVEQPFMPEEQSIEFRCRIEPSNSDSVSECALNIAEALYGLKSFLPTWTLDISSWQVYDQTNEKNSSVMKQLIKEVSQNYKDLLYPHHDE